MTKLKSTENKPTSRPKEKKSKKLDIFDQDSAWKNYITTNIFDCIEALNSDLHESIDTSVPPEFLEQELINIIRGKYKIKNKEKKTDKLVKFQLLNGESHYIFVHLEFQSKLEDNFSERIYIYRSLISLRYQTQNITTFVIFTGKSPSDKHKVFELDCFGSFIHFRYNTYTIFEGVAGAEINSSLTPVGLVDLILNADRKSVV